MTFNGTGTRGVSFMTDGIGNDDYSENQSRQQVNVSTIREVEVLTNAFSAEFGRALERWSWSTPRPAPTPPTAMPTGSTPTVPLTLPTTSPTPPACTTTTPAGNQEKLPLAAFLPTAAQAAAKAWPWYPGSNGVDSLGRNTFWLEGISNWDISIIKNVRTRERHMLTYRLEMYNSFKRVQFGFPAYTSVADNQRHGLAVAAESGPNQQPKQQPPQHDHDAPVQLLGSKP